MERAMKNKQLADHLRRDATFVGNAAITVVVFGFAALALAATLYDVIALHQ
jgi:hypothetical protein